MRMQHVILPSDYLDTLFFLKYIDPNVPFFFTRVKKNRTGHVFYAISKHRIKRKYKAALASWLALINRVENSHNLSRLSSLFRQSRNQSTFKRDTLKMNTVLKKNIALITSKPMHPSQAAPRQTPRQKPPPLHTPPSPPRHARASAEATPP